MSWNYETSLKRIKERLETAGQIEIEKLVRDADLRNLLSETVCREIFGAHVYVDLPNFAKLASEIEGEEYRRVIQAVHLYQREVTRIVEDEEMFDGVRVHFQGPKLHALFFRPIDASADLAAKAVLLQAVLREFVATVFNPAYPSLEDLEIAGGADIGDSIGTQDGMKGDRELLFIGAPANYAAKIVAGAGKVRLTERVFKSLPKEVRPFCSQTKEGEYSLDQIGSATLRNLLEVVNVKWDPKKSSERLDEEKRKFPLKDILYSDAETLIDLDSLSIVNNKRVLATSLFADVDGFTRYVDKATTVAEKKSALKVFHAIRHEMAAVIKHDFSGLRIQYQGDRVQALFHLPKDKPSSIVEKAVEAATGLQSSMEYTLKECLPESASLSLAVGIDVDLTLVSKLGIRSERDRICVGLGVEDAEECQERCRGRETGVTSEVYALLDGPTKQNFSYDKERDLYVAAGLTAEVAERQKKAAAYAGGGSVFVSSGNAGTKITTTEVPGARHVLPSRSYGS
jgi:class 3 adenylate cyclase